MTSRNALLYLRRAISVLLHAGLVILANVLAFWLRFDGVIPDDYAALGLELLPWLVAIRLLLFVPFRLFEGLWRYTSLWDLRNILLGVTISTVAFYLVAMSTAGANQYPRSIHIIDAVLLVCMMTGIRLTRRIYGEVLKPPHGRRVLIYGAGDAGELVVREMRQSAKFDATPIGFVDDDESKVGQQIHGVPVFGGRSKLPAIIKAHAPDELLLALPSASRETLREIVRALEPYKIRITTLPRLREVIGAGGELELVRQLRVEDLLARETIGLDYAPVRQYLEGKCVVVTGAGGSIGSELCRQIAVARPASLILLDRYENSVFQIHNELTGAFPNLTLHSVIADVTDGPRIEQVFGGAKPHVIFHAAAHKHVPLMEANPCEAVKNNVRGTRVVAEAAFRWGAERFILISTDKAVNPTSVMGSTKRVAELTVESLGRTPGTRFASVRFGNVLGSNGSVVPTFLAQIAKGGPVTVTDREMRRYFMLIPEAVQLVLHAGALSDQAPLFVLEMGEQVKVVDMARDLIRLAGYVPDKDIAIEFTGVRPGEKLFEELVGEREFAEPSSLEKIMRVKPASPRRLDGLMEAILRLEELAVEGRNEEVLRDLAALLSDFSAGRAEPNPAQISPA